MPNLGKKYSCTLREDFPAIKTPWDSFPMCRSDRFGSRFILFCLQFISLFHIHVLTHDMNAHGFTIDTSINSEGIKFFLCFCAFLRYNKHIRKILGRKNCPMGTDKPPCQSRQNVDLLPAHDGKSPQYLYFPKKSCISHLLRRCISFFKIVFFKFFSCHTVFKSISSSH